MSAKMSLRFRLNVCITLSFLATLLIGSLLVIGYARRDVAEETHSTANLALGLVQVAFASAGPDSDPLNRILLHLSQLEKTRHLHIDFVGPDGAIDKGLPAAGVMHKPDAPEWFVQLVKPPPLQLRRTVNNDYGVPTQIIIEADPADEIREIWKEARAMLFLLLAFCLLSNGLVFVVLGRSLRPVHDIIDALDRVEKGHYQSRLPSSGTVELDAIAGRFNHMVVTLERSRRQNRQLAQQSLAIQEQERRHLAHELHDELGQSISAIKALAVSIGQRSAVAPAPAANTGQASVADSARTIADTSQRVYDVVRNMMRRLRPVILDELGLVPALQAVIDDWNEGHEEVFCRFRSEGDLSALNDEIKINVYRIVQEALTNVAKHAHAGAVDIDIRRQSAAEQDGKDVLLLHIADDGSGMDPEKQSWGLGLLGMRERCEAMNGRFELQSQPGKGLSIDMRLPVEPPDKPDTVNTAMNTDERNRHAG